jgi:hypothetical protein
MHEDEVFADRECDSFFERIPGMATLDHFDYKIRRDNIGNAYRAARRSIMFALASLVIAVVSLLRSFNVL